MLRDDQGLGDERLERDVLARVADAVEVDAGACREEDARRHAGERREQRLTQPVLLVVNGPKRCIYEPAGSPVGERRVKVLSFDAVLGLGAEVLDPSEIWAASTRAGRAARQVNLLRNEQHLLPAIFNISSIK